MALSAGTALGTYHIIGPLGAGGMGEVYRARDTKLNRDVAIKVLPDLVAQDRDRLTRFEREAQLLASLNHPNIASIYGMHESDGVLAIVMELVEGDTLDARLKPRAPAEADGTRRSSGATAIDEAIDIARQIAVGLEAAHDKGIIHRDLKPANVKRTPDGTVKILDFGLAKALADDTAAASDLSHSPTVTAVGTRDGVILGTAAYMSPEQARGLVLDERTDIWAFGCILYELLAGRSAFGAATASDVLVSVLSREPDWSALPAATPPAVRRLLRRCLEKDRRRRLHAIADARIEIEDARTDDLAVRPQPASRDRSTWLGWAVAAIAVATAILFAVRGSGARPDAAPSLMDATPEALTHDAGLTTAPAISPDGRLVAYASDRSGRGDLDIWIQQVAGGAPLQLTDDPVDESAPSFSPDGSQIVFRSERDGGGVYVVSTLGGDPRLIARQGRRPQFSPDGSRIAYWTGPGRGSEFVSAATYVVALGGGTARRVLPEFAVALNPIWSPDGRSLLVTAARGSEGSNAYDWWVVPIDTASPFATGAGGLVPVKASFEGPLPGYQWRKDDVLFSDGSSLWSLPVSPAGRPAGSAHRLTLGVERLRDPSASRDNAIVFAASTLTRVIERVPLDGRTLRSGPLYTDNRPEEGRASQTGDGTMLVIPRDREIWTRDLRTGKDRFVVRVEGRGVLNATVSPDGTRIAYGASDGSGANDGYVIETAGGVPRRVCERCEPHHFLSDNRRLLLQAQPGTLGPLQLVDTSTGAAQVLIASSDLRLDRPHASPDDRLLAFRANSSGGKTFVAPLTPGNPPPRESWAEVEEPTITGRPAGWSSDARVLYLLLDTDGFRCVWAQRVDAAGKLIGSPYAVRHFHGANDSSFGSSFGNAVTAEGFLVEATRRLGNIWMLKGASSAAP